MVERANVKAPASPEAGRRRDTRWLVRQQNNPAIRPFGPSPATLAAPACRFTREHRRIPDTGGFHRSPRSVPGSILAVCDSLGFLWAVALGLDVSYCVASHFLSDLRDRGDRECRCRLLPAHLEPYLVAGRRGGSSYQLGLEFRDVLRLHLAPALVLKFHDGGWRSLAETAYL
jgi:hypothetical protein